MECRKKKWTRYIVPLSIILMLTAQRNYMVISEHFLMAGVPNDGYCETFIVVVLLYKTVITKVDWLSVFQQAAVGYEYEGKTEAHASQKGESRFFNRQLLPVYLKLHISVCVYS